MQNAARTEGSAEKSAVSASVVHLASEEAVPDTHRLLLISAWKFGTVPLMTQDGVRLEFTTVDDNAQKEGAQVRAFPAPSMHAKSSA